MAGLYYPPTENGLQKTLNAGLDAGVVSAATLNNMTGVQNKKGVLVVDRIDSNGTLTPSKREYISFEGTSGSTVTTLVRGLAGSTDQDHAIGAVVEFVPDVVMFQEFIDAISNLVDPATSALDTTKVANLSSAQTLTNKTLASPNISVGSDAAGDMYFRNAGASLTRLALGTSGQVLTANASVPYWASASAGVAFWSSVPGTPTWVAVNQFSITDASNANSYDKLFAKGALFRWDDGAFKTAMAANASYASDKVYIALLGSTLSTVASMPSMKYSIPTIDQTRETFIIPGTLPTAATTDIAKTVRFTAPVHVLGADFGVKTGGSGATLTIIDININGTTKFTTKPSLQTLATLSLNNVADVPETATAADSYMTIDVDNGNTTAPSEAYIYVYYYPAAWRYRS